MTYRVGRGGRPPVAENAHGLNGYNWHGCRCGDCRAAKAEYQREYRRRKL